MFVGIDRVTARAYTIPTDRPEADGTLAWRQTTLVAAFIEAGGKTGLGYSYTAAVDAALIREKFCPLLVGKNVLDIPSCWQILRRGSRNLGLSGLVACAIAAVDTALWDLKAKLFDAPLTALLGKIRERAPVYGSGGFTTYARGELTRQIEAWKEQGIERIKIKVGTDPQQDIARVRWAREALDLTDELMVDGNGAYTAQQALALAEAMREYRVRWFEEPVASGNLHGLRLLRNRAPAGMEIAAGEYGYELADLQRLLSAGAVDVLQVDATRAQGYSGFMHAVSLALVAQFPLSSHCAPALHLPVCCQAPGLRHMEYFHDHARIEQMLFDGAPAVVDGHLTPSGAPGHGLILKQRDAEKYAV